MQVLTSFLCLLCLVLSAVPSPAAPHDPTSPGRGAASARLVLAQADAPAGTGAVTDGARHDEALSGGAQASAPHLTLTPEERRYIADNPVFSASNESNWPPFNFNVNGLPQGYSVDYLNMLAQLAGLKVRYVIGPQWDEFEHALQQGRLDVLMNMATTPEREAYTDFTPPYATLVHGIVFRDGQSPPPTLDSLAGRTVAVPKGFFTETVLRENYPDIKLVTPPDALGCLQAVATGKAEAAIGSLPVQNYLIKKHFLVNLQTRALVDNKHFPTVNIRFGVTKSKPVLARILTKAMAAVGEKQMSELRQKWLSADRMDQKYIPLTPSEQEMLTRLGAVRLCVHPDWMPFSRIDADGKFEGMAADAVNRMAERIGVSLKLVPTATWAQSLDYLAQGKCDLIPAVSPTEERQKFMAFTRPYLTSPVVAATLQDTLFVPDLSSLAGKRIGAVRGQPWTEDIRRDYPEIQLVETDSVEAGLRLVRDRKLFAFVDTMAAISDAIGKEHYTDMKIAGKLDSDLALSVGVNKQNPLLAQIFDMAVASLSEKERNEIFSRWISITFEHGFDYGLFWKILAGLAVAVAAIFYWNRKLVRLNQAVTRANADLNQAHAKISMLLDNSGQGFLSFGPDGTVEPERSRECDRLFGQPAAGASIAALLHPGDATAQEAFARNIGRILNQADDYKRDLLLSLMPHHFVLGDKQVDAQYKLLGGGRLMLILTDVTDKCALEAEVEGERKRLAMIVAAVRDKDDFFSVLQEFDRFRRARVRGEAGVGVDGGWDLPSLYRHVHTFKGLLLQLDFIRTPCALHELEAVLAAWQAAGRSEAEREAFAAAWRDCGCDTALEQDLRTIRQTLGDAFFERGQQALVPMEAIERLESLADRLKAKAAELGLGAAYDDLMAQVRRLRLRDLRDLLAAYPESVRKLAARADKVVAPFAVEGDPVPVSPKAYAPFVASLVHVFRNAVVHGVEDPELRLEAGKPEAGHIACRVEDGGETLRIVVTDDGAGIDLEALRKRARGLGLSPTGEAREDLNLIFERGLTTQRDADSLAGRGVGLYAVMDKLKRLGGTVTVTSTPGQGTTFVFSLPKRPAGPEADAS
jgi:ABC-type amino acid transport substrate-binding protein